MPTLPYHVIDRATRRCRKLLQEASFLNFRKEEVVQLQQLIRGQKEVGRYFAMARPGTKNILPSLCVLLVSGDPAENEINLQLFWLMHYNLR